MRKKNFEDIRSLVKSLVICAVITCVAAMLFGSGNELLQGVLLLVTMAFIIAAVVVIFLYSRCPSCGKIIAFNMLRVTCCPNCKRNLITGKKMKSKSR